MVRLMILAGVLASGLHAATFTVTPDGSSGYSNIQAAIDAAPLGETNEIVVHPGVYAENLVVPGSARLSIRSTSIWSDAVRDATIVDGQLNGSVVRASGGTDGELMLAGLYLTSGSNDIGGGVQAGTSTGTRRDVNVLRCHIANCQSRGDSFDDGGGGIAYSSGDVLSNTLHSNFALKLGGGIYNCSGLCAWNLVYDNRADLGGGGLGEILGELRGNIVSNNYGALQGGGIRVIRSDAIGNTVVNNYSGQDGGGIFYLERNRVFNNIVRGNVASEDGGGICDYSSTVKDSLDFVNNLICDNIASNYGGGVAHFHNNLFLNNTIAGNMALYGGGGVWRCRESTYVNCLIASNRVAVSGKANIEDVDFSYFAHCCIPGADGLDATSLTVDPHFVDASNGNYRLMADSPCIDAGLDNMHYPVSFVADIDGNLRISNTIDIGCFEFGSPADRDADRLIDADEPGLGADPTKWDTNGDGFPDGLHIERGQAVSEALTTMVHSVSAGTPIMAAAARSIAGDVIQLAPGTFTGFVYPQYATELRGATDAAGAPQSVVDGGGVYPCLVLCRQSTFPGSVAPTRIAHLVLSNGLGAYGGGISIQRPSYYTEVEGCRIVHNRAAYGGGVASEGVSSVACTLFEGNYIAHNAAEFWGGGVYGVKFPFDDERGITANMIVNNTASNGGGLAFCEALVERNTIASNHAAYGGGGIARVLERIRNNLIVANVALMGGGMYDSSKSYDEDIQNNTFVANVASNEGGGYFLDRESSVRIVNNIFWSNDAPARAQMHLTGATTNVWFNTIQGWTNGLPGNQALAPLFVDWATGDFRIHSNDTATIDTGTNYSSMLLAQRDRDGGPRVVGNGVDRGCYEWFAGEIDFLGSDSRFVLFLDASGQRYMQLAILDVPAAGTHADGDGNPTQLGVARHPWPRGDEGTFGSACVSGSGTILAQVNHMYGGYAPQYYYPSATPADWGWKDMNDQLGPYAGRCVSIHGRDGVPNGFAAVSQGTSSDSNVIPTVVYSATISQTLNTQTATLPFGNMTATIGLANDSFCASGTDPGRPWGAAVVSLNGGGPVAVVNSALGPDNDTTWAPAYVDTDGDGQYDDYKAWNTSGSELRLVDVVNGSAQYTTTLPGQFNGSVVIGSTPGAVVVAQSYGDQMAVYTPPASLSPLPGRGPHMIGAPGTWYSNTLPGAIVRIGSAVSTSVIPEPMFAVALYVLCAAALLCMYRR